MPTLYFTPSTVGYLTELILAVAITFYLATRLRRTARQMQTALLLGFFATTTLLIFLLFLDAALPPDQRPYAVFLDYVIVATLLLFLVQFAYHFPEPIPQLRHEARAALVATSVYALFEAAYAVFRFLLLADGQLASRPIWMYLFMVVGLLWVPFVLLRQTVYASRREDPKVFGNPSGLYHLWRPRGQSARAARAIALAFLSPLCIGVVNVLTSLSILPTNVDRLSFSIGILLGMFAIAVIYLNHLPETTTFIVKLVGAALVSVLVVLATVGWVMTPAYAAAFQPMLPNQQTLRFSPNSIGGYDVTVAPFHFDRELGARLNVVNGDSEASSAPMDFAFPFYGQTYPQVFVGNDGAIGLGQRVRYQNIQYRYGRTPAIFPFYLALDPEQSQGGVFARQTADRLLLTWDQVPGYLHRETVFTFQMTLYSSGVFEISYAGLPANVHFDPDDKPEASVYLIGAVRGDPNFAPQPIDFSRLPAQTGDQGFVQDFYMAFRQYLHQALLLLVLLILASTFLIVLGLPVFIRYDLVKPLNALLAGVQQVDAGKLDVEMPIHHSDEIGYLTQAFNRMVAQLRNWVKTLEARVAERTQELEATNVRLRQEIIEREQAETQVLEHQRVYAAMEERERLARELHDGLGQIMGYINVQAQATQTLLTQGETPAAQANLGHMAQVAREAQSDIRGYILGLRADAPFKQNLFEAVREALRQFGLSTGIETHLSVPDAVPSPAFAPAVEEQVLHIIQEALINIHKHAAARKVEVLFSFAEDWVQVIIADNGTGFDPAADMPVGHFGLSVMRERANQVGGQIEFRSAPGQGTQVLLHVPRFLPSSAPDLADVQGLRVLIADDHPLFADGLRNLLSARGMTVVGVAHDGLQAQELARALRPDLIVMDIHMPRCSGLEATRAIKAELPESKIVMLTISEDEHDVFEAIKFGACGYLLKSLDANEFCSLLVSVMNGQTPLAPGLAARVLSEFAHRASAPVEAGRVPAPSVPAQPPAGLTARQWEILQMVARGLPYKEIAATLHVSERTVKYHMGEILERLRLETREQAIAYAGRIQSK